VVGNGLRVRPVDRFTLRRAVLAMDAESQIRAPDGVLAAGSRERRVLRAAPRGVLAGAVVLDPGLAPAEAARKALQARQ